MLVPLLELGRGFWAPASGVVELRYASLAASVFSTLASGFVDWLDFQLKWFHRLSLVLTAFHAIALRVFAVYRSTAARGLMRFRRGTRLVRLSIMAVAVPHRFVPVACLRSRCTAMRMPCLRWWLSCLFSATYQLAVSGILAILRVRDECTNQN